jgi:endoglucanase
MTRRRNDPPPTSGGGRLAGLVLAGVLAGALALAVWHWWPRDPYALPAADWRVFKERFLTSEGRIVDTGNGGVSHTEGQGYGMLFAVAYDDRAAFERMWEWTRTRLRRPADNLFSWRWTPEGGGRIDDRNNASDGDLLLTWALLRASRQWKDYAFQKAAAQIVIGLQTRCLVETRLGVQLLPGVEGFEKPEGTICNPSYYVFPALADLAASFPATKWSAVAGGGRALIEAARFGKWGLPPDWVLIAPNAVEIAGLGEPVFGYNAIRVPLHIAWADPASPLLKPFADFWGSLPPDAAPPATVNLDDNSFGPNPALPGMRVVIRYTQACVAGGPITVAELPMIDHEEPYYSASLKLLTKLAIHERFGMEKN